MKRQFSAVDAKVRRIIGSGTRVPSLGEKKEMRSHKYGAWLVAVAGCLAMTSSTAAAQTARFSGFNDAVSGRCYEPASTAPDATNPNLLRIGMVGCSTSAPNGTPLLMDTFSFAVEAPDGYFVSKITFTQSGTSGGSRGGTGFRGVSWVVDQTAAPVAGITGGWAGVRDLSLQRKTVVPVSITTFLAAFGIQVVSGHASATNPTVLVELASLEQ